MEHETLQNLTQSKCYGAHTLGKLFEFFEIVEMQPSVHIIIIIIYLLIATDVVGRGRGRGDDDCSAARSHRCPSTTILYDLFSSIGSEWAAHLWN